MDKKLLQKRFWAFYVDLLSVLIIDQVFMKSYITFLQAFFYRMPSPTQIMFFKQFHKSASINFFIIYVCYYSVFEFAANGQTFGKMILGIKTFNRDRSRIKFWQAAIRGVFGLLNYMMFGIPSLILYKTKGQLGPLEYISKTFVEDENYFELKEKDLKELGLQNEIDSQMTIMDYVDSQTLHNLHCFGQTKDEDHEELKAA